MKTMSAAEIIHLRRTRHAVYVYPKLRDVVVDGFKRYTISAKELQQLYQANNGFAN